MLSLVCWLVVCWIFCGFKISMHTVCARGLFCYVLKFSVILWYIIIFFYFSRLFLNFNYSINFVLFRIKKKKKIRLIMVSIYTQSSANWNFFRFFLMFVWILLVKWFLINMYVLWSFLACFSWALCVEIWLKNQQSSSYGWLSFEVPEDEKLLDYWLSEMPRRMKGYNLSVGKS